MEHPAALAKITQNFYRREWERWPSNGSRTGLVEYDDRLEVPTADLIADQVNDLVSTKQQVEKSYEPAAGTLEFLDRKSLLAHLDREHLSLTAIQHWRTNPIEPVESAIGSIFGLLMRRDVSKPETAEAIRKRLLSIPAYLGATRRNIAKPLAVIAPTSVVANTRSVP